ncbi:unnamed protein product [Owenia fusiformis]|uniref:Uncharacterized protein n=1 Tax=Owenia fusiformis TaxID=6347 RepID=A0A8J1T6N5_OWEFU|nr:unnamed protein product [Owenia fusiformis]
MPMIGNVNNGKVGVPRMLGKHANNALIKDNLVKKAAFLDPAHQLNQLPMIGQANHHQYGQNNQQYGQNNQQYGRNNQQYGGNNQQYGQNYHQIVQNNAPKIRDRLPPNRALIAEANHNLNYSEYWINHVTLQHKRGYSVEKSEKARVIENSKTDGGAEAAYFAWLMEKQLGCYPRDLHQFGNGVNQWTMCNTGRLALKHPCIVYSFGNFAAHSLSDNTHFHAIGLWDDDIDTRNVRDISLNQLSTIIKQTGHGNMMIDLLKIDIDNILWNVLPSIKDGCWKRVKQLIIRVYGPGDGLQVPSVQKMYRILAQVERFGFLKYNVQPCPKQKIVSKFTNNLLFPCFDISYVNKPYIG